MPRVTERGDSTWGNGADLPRYIGAYAVERQLGAGGMGTVYLARSRGGRAVAVKVARPELAADSHFRQRFRAEVEAARRVGGFHTAQVVDADPEAEAPWLATAYVPGPTLSALLAEQGPMAEPRLRLLGTALAEALQAIHDCGLVHRDLKPGNIIWAEDGPRVLDFGIARAVESTRLTSTGAAFGTPGFLAPEQAQGFEVSGAADVFALGAVLVAAAGGSAFGAGTPLGLMYRAVHEPADVSAVPQELRAVVADCLAKEPAHRPTPDRLLDLFLPGPASDTPSPVASVHELPTMPASSPTTRHMGTDGCDTPSATQEGFSGAEPNGGTPAVGTDGQGISLARDEPHADGTLLLTPATRSRRRVMALAVAAVAVLGALVGGAVYLTHQDDHSGTPSASPSASRQASSPAGGPGPAQSVSSDAPKGQVTVVINAKATRSWISAKDSGGRLLFDGLLNPGESKTFTDKDRLDLVLGNAGAIQLVVNGKPAQEQFEEGKVERLTYTRND